MKRSYTKVEGLATDVFRRKEAGETNRQIAESSPLFDITAPDKYPEFSGSIRYTSKFNFSSEMSSYTVLDLGQVGEVAEVYLNGVSLGTRINAPYKFSMEKSLQNGENNLEIIVTNNLGHRRRDFLSTFIQIPPSGIIGDISICKYE